MTLPYSCCCSVAQTCPALCKPGRQHTTLPCPSPPPRAGSNSGALSWWCHPTNSSSVTPFSSFPQSFPESGSFPMSWLFISGENVYFTMLYTAKSLQSCPTLCNPIDSSLPGSPVPGILQARTLEWVAVSFSNAWKWKVKGKSLSRVRPSATPWTAAHQAPPWAFPGKSTGVGCHCLLRLCYIDVAIFNMKDSVDFPNF